MAVKKTIEQKIDDLAAATARGFEEIGGKMDDVVQRLDRIEFSVNGHERRMEVMEDKIRQISVKIGLKLK